MQVLVGSLTRQTDGVVQTEWNVEVPGVFLVEHAEALRQAFDEVSGSVRGIFVERMTVHTRSDVTPDTIRGIVRQAIPEPSRRR